MQCQLPSAATKSSAAIIKVKPGNFGSRYCMANKLYIVNVLKKTLQTMSIYCTSFSKEGKKVDFCTSFFTFYFTLCIYILGTDKKSNQLASFSNGS